MKVLINNEEVVCSNDFTIEQEMLSTPSVILNNVYPKSWENDKDYVSRFYYPEDYSKCLIYDGEDLIFAGVVENTGEISLNPRYPHYCNLQVLSFKCTGKRIFKMAPIHHHFELCGWKENHVVMIFSIITLMVSIIGLQIV